MAAPRIHLLIIDPQHDFCDLPGASLPVAGASADLERLSTLIAQRGADLAAIHVTLDSHQVIDIAHPGWWQDAAGQAPAPFTVISSVEVAEGRWRARDPAQQAHSSAYVQALEQRQRYQLVIWPEHCLLGSWGHSVYQPLQTTLQDWARHYQQPVHYQLKGLNPGTEHYSALQAEVPDPCDPHTQAPSAWLAQLSSADEIWIAGEALSHCVASTVRDLVALCGPAIATKLVLLRDCTSPVAGFAALGDEFITTLTQQGMRLKSSTDLI